MKSTADLLADVRQHIADGLALLPVLADELERLHLENIKLKAAMAAGRDAREVDPASGD